MNMTDKVKMDMKTKSGPNWRTVGIGFGEVGMGVSSVIGGATIAVGSSGIAGIAAAGAVTEGVIMSGVGFCDIFLGLYGEKTVMETISDYTMGKNLNLGEQLIMANISMGIPAEITSVLY